jgi:hypothetical protein
MLGNLLRWSTATVLIGCCVTALLRADTFYPGSNYPSAVGNAALVKVLLTAVPPFQRIEAARQLGASGDPSAIQALSTAAVSDSDSRVRQAASEAIAQIRNTSGGGFIPRPPPPVWPPINPPGPVLPPGPVDPHFELVQCWYQQYLHRSADRSGLQGWVNMLRRGASHEEVQAAIISSDEYYRVHGGSPVGFVNGLYDDVLRRRPRGNDLNYWLDKLRQHGGNRQRVAADFLREAQPELQQRPGVGVCNIP